MSRRRGADAGAVPASPGVLAPSQRLERLRDWGWLAPWAVLLAAPLLLRAPSPPDELRYLAVAWEMWSSGDLLVPHLNGLPYADKPPLLFWLMHAGWAVLGVDAWWPRALPALLALTAALAARALCRALAPGDDAAARAVPWLLLGALAWTLYTQVLLFDLLLVNCTLLGLLGLERAERGAAGGWPLVAAATALGLLTKGPAMLLHLSGPALLGPWWARSERLAPGRWYGRLGLTLLAGALAAGAWAVAAALSGGEAYARELLLGQTTGRIVDSFAHARPFWFYVWMLPLLLAPWTLWPAGWRAVGRTLGDARADPAGRFLLAAVVPAFIGFSLISGKQPHYMLPLVPPLAILGAVALSARAAADSAVAARIPALAVAAAAAGIALVPLLPVWSGVEINAWSPVWGLAAAALMLPLARAGPWPAVVRRLTLVMPLFLVAFEAAFFTANPIAYDVTDAAREIRNLREADHPIAYAGDYNGEFQFPGRLTEPLDVVAARRETVAAWAQRHPDGYVVTDLDTRPDAATYTQPLRGAWLAITSAPEAVAWFDPGR